MRKKPEAAVYDPKPDPAKDPAEAAHRALRDAQDEADRDRSIADLGKTFDDAKYAERIDRDVTRTSDVLLHGGPALGSRLRVFMDGLRERVTEPSVKEIGKRTLDFNLFLHPAAVLAAAKDALHPNSREVAMRDLRVSQRSLARKVQADLEEHIDAIAQRTRTQYEEAEKRVLDTRREIARNENHLRLLHQQRDAQTQRRGVVPPGLQTQIDDTQDTIHLLRQDLKDFAREQFDLASHLEAVSEGSTKAVEQLHTEINARNAVRVDDMRSTLEQRRDDDVERETRATQAEIRNLDHEISTWEHHQAAQGLPTSRLPDNLRRKKEKLEGRLLRERRAVNARYGPLFGTFQTVEETLLRRNDIMRRPSVMGQEGFGKTDAAGNPLTERDLIPEGLDPAVEARVKRAIDHDRRWTEVTMARINGMDEAAAIAYFDAEFTARLTRPGEADRAKKRLREALASMKSNIPLQKEVPTNAANEADMVQRFAYNTQNILPFEGRNQIDRHIYKDPLEAGILAAAAVFVTKDKRFDRVDAGRRRGEELKNELRNPKLPTAPMVVVGPPGATVSVNIDPNQIDTFTRKSEYSLYAAALLAELESMVRPPTPGAPAPSFPPLEGLIALYTAIEKSLPILEKDSKYDRMPRGDPAKIKANPAHPDYKKVIPGYPESSIMVEIIQLNEFLQRAERARRVFVARKQIDMSTFQRYQVDMLDQIEDRVKRWAAEQRQLVPHS